MVASDLSRTQTRRQATGESMVSAFKQQLAPSLIPKPLFEADRVVDGEQRWQATGIVDGRSLLLIVHTPSEEGAVEVIRIISAREANRAERRRYEEANGSI